MLLVSGDVRAELLQQPVELREVAFVKTVSQALVELDHLLAEREKHRLSGVGELDVLDTPVVRITPAAHETGRFHPIQVVGKGRALDADGLGDVALVAVGSALQFDEDQPLRQ